MISFKFQQITMEFESKETRNSCARREDNLITIKSLCFPRATHPPQQRLHPDNRQMDVIRLEPLTSSSHVFFWLTTLH